MKTAKRKVKSLPVSEPELPSSAPSVEVLGILSAKVFREARKELLLMPSCAADQLLQMVAKRNVEVAKLNDEQVMDALLFTAIATTLGYGIVDDYLSLVERVEAVLTKRQHIFKYIISTICRQPPVTFDYETQPYRGLKKFFEYLLHTYLTTLPDLCKATKIKAK